MGHIVYWVESVQRRRELYAEQQHDALREVEPHRHVQRERRQRRSFGSDCSCYKRDNPQLDEADQDGLQVHGMEH